MKKKKKRRRRGKTEYILVVVKLNGNATGQGLFTKLTSPSPLCVCRALRVYGHDRGHTSSPHTHIA